MRHFVRDHGVKSWRNLLVWARRPRPRDGLDFAFDVLRIRRSEGTTRVCVRFASGRLVQRPDAKCWSRPAQYRFHWSVEGLATCGAGWMRVCAATTRSLILRDARSLTDPFPFCSFMRLC